MKKKTAEFSLNSLYADIPASKSIWAFIPRDLLQYAQGYARYRYDLTGRPMSPTGVCAEAIHMYYKKLLKAIPESQGLKIPDWHMAIRGRRNANDVYERVLVYIPYAQYQHIKQAIAMGYLYCNYARPSLSAVVREALYQHYANYKSTIENHAKKNPWSLV